MAGQLQPQASSLPWFSNGLTNWTGTGTLGILSTMFVVGWTSAMRFSQPRNQLRFFSHPVPSGVQTIFPPGLYTVRIRVDAQNAADVEGTFDIDFTHGWSQITITVA